MNKESAPLYECHVNTNEGADTFVGIRSDGEQIKVCFPVGYNLGKTDAEQKNDIQLLIRVLTRFSGIKEQLLPKLLINNPETVNFPIQAYMTILNEYYNRGYYTENERVFTVNGTGPKSWSRTIKTQRAYPQDDSFIYLTTIAQESRVDTANYITKINEFCVEEAYKKVGFLFSADKVRRSSISFDEKRFIMALKEKLRNENTLSIKEAAVYFNIGIKKMRRLAEENMGVFALVSGNRYLIIRTKFEEYLQNNSTI